MVLLLLVLPTALLTLVAGHALRDRELFLDARIQASARNAVRAVAQNVSTHLAEDLVDLKTAVADALQRGGNEAELQKTLRPLIESHPLIHEVTVFMNPWGFVFAPAKESEYEAAVRSELTEVLRREIAGGDALQSFIPVSLEDRAWQFSRIDARRALYIGMEISRSGMIDLLRESVMTFSGGGITLCAVGPGLDHPIACDADQGAIVVTDSFSGNTTGFDESVGTRNVSGSLVPSLQDVLVETRLSSPLDPIRVTAWATDPEALRRGQRRGLQVQAWGIGLLAVCMGLGIALVLRLTSSEVRAARARSEFVIGVSHDLRTPIASMKMLTESLVAGRVADADKRQHFLRVMLRECERLNQLVERVLFFVRFGQGDMAYQRQVMDPGALVQGAVQAFRARHSMMNAHRGSVEPRMDTNGHELENIASRDVTGIPTSSASRDSAHGCLNGEGEERGTTTDYGLRTTEDRGEEDGGRKTEDGRRQPSEREGRDGGPSPSGGRSTQALESQMVSVKFSEKLPAVKVDGTAMTQVLLNLLDNAWKYSGRGERERERTTDYGLRTTDGGLGEREREKTTDYGLRTTEGRGQKTEDGGQEEREGERTTDYGLQTTDGKKGTGGKGQHTSRIPHPASHISHLTSHSPHREAPITVTVRSVVEKRQAWEAEREWVAVSVEDKGIGIDSEIQKLIFQKFYRGPGARNSNVSGVGVGLALCRHVVRGHGGRIDVESTPGKGSTFTIYLPVAKKDV